MPSIAKLLQYGTPGVYINEDTYGSVPNAISTHDTVYVVGTCTSTTFPTDKPVYISNYADFLNQVGSSPSAAAIKLFFEQKSGKGLYFSRVPTRTERVISGFTNNIGVTYAATINGQTVAYTSVTGDSILTVAANFLAALKTALAGVVTGYVNPATDSIVIRTKPADTVVSASVVTVGLPTLATSPVATDVVDSVNNTFVPENEQGFLCCPEFYQGFNFLSERVILQTQLDAFCAQPDYLWVHVVDCGLATAVTTTGNGGVALAQAEQSSFVSPRGNSWYYFPYLTNLNDLPVPASLAVIGAGLRRARAEGIYQPFAGVKTVIYGVKGTSLPVSAVQQAVLNPKGINCIRSLPNRGVVAYGARTLSANSFYKFSSIRIVLNILAGTLRSSFDEQLFSLVDGQGALLSRIAATADTKCEQLRLAGALYGASPSDAYLNICDTTNNTTASLESGIVYLDCIVKPSPTMEVLAITVSRSSLGQVLATIAGSGDTATSTTPPVTSK